MQIFAKLAKFDENTGYFEAIAADESVDKAGEIFDYESSKPHFVKWSDTICKASDGKNLGNVRAMHGKVAAGKLSDLIFDDSAKAIKVAGFVVDANEKTKMAAGVYTGVSIGGSYGKTWDDPVVKGARRYEAIPSEISIVDNPCNGNAHFTVVKADGTEELRKFETTFDDTESLAKWFNGLSDAQRETLAKVAKRPGVSPKEGEDKYGDVKFADEKNKKYPINTPAHIRAAWNYINKPHNAEKYDAADLKSIKAKIIAAWKEKIDSAGPPSARKDKAAEKAAHFDCVASLLIEKNVGESIAKAAGELIGKPMEKGLWTVSRLADLLESLNCIADSTKFEAEIEGDGSALPAELRTAVTNLSEILIHMVAEEVEEMNAGEDVEVMELAATGDLAKNLTTEEDTMTTELQKAHDLAKADLAKAQEELTKVSAERDELQKGIAERDELLMKAATALNERNELIAKLESAPAPMKAALLAVSKNHDVVSGAGDDVEKVLNPDGSVDAAATAIKKALHNPVVRR